jgi:DNA polymerase V
MQDLDMCEGDILIVDKSIKPSSGRVVIVILDGQMLVRQLQYMGNEIHLISANKQYPATIVTTNHALEIWGVVTYVIHKC